MKKKQRKLFEYDQNNSGGHFVENETLCHRVVIEADNTEEADRIAEEKGIYFDGCADDRDCDCCGDRWYRAWNHLEFPMKYGEGVIFANEKQYLQHLANEYMSWTSPEARVFYKKKKTLEIFSESKDESYNITKRTS